MGQSKVRIFTEYRWDGLLFFKIVLLSHAVFIATNYLPTKFVAKYKVYILTRTAVELKACYCITNSNECCVVPLNVKKMKVIILWCGMMTPFYSFPSSSSSKNSSSSGPLLDEVGLSFLILSFKTLVRFSARIWSLWSLSYCSSLCNQSRKVKSV